MDTSNGWNEQHDKYAKTDWINKPSLFAEWAKNYFPKVGEVLELGCGQGQDSRFFAGLGYQVTALDFSEQAIKYAKEKTDSSLSIDFRVADFSKSLDFDSNSFDAVYSHLALHYFTEEDTKKLFSEISRVLKLGGLLAFLVNSINDPEHGKGEKIEDDYFRVGKVSKRFFDIKSVKNFTHDFEIVALDNGGETYKDRAIGTENLIRFIGKKK